jgi:hypothetical protein
MKKRILPILLLIVTISATAVAATKKDPRQPVTKEIKIKQPFQKLLVNGNVDVILFEDSSSSITVIGGSDKEIKAVEIKELNGVLTIDCRKSTGKRIQVVVPVHGLSAIEAGGASRVSAVTTLQSPELTLLINNDCEIGVRSTGKINVVEGNETVVNYWAVGGKNE